MARNPHPQGGLATPPPDLDDAEPEQETPAGLDGDEGLVDVGDDSADDAPENSPDAAPARTASGGGFKPVADGAGWVLGLLLWGWIGIPFLKGGPAQVKKVWMAKFLNKAPDGSFLP